MTELRFKLKKDGRTVGFLYIKDGCISVCSPAFDSIHPFVCQDRHGKDVYEGDEIFSYGQRCFMHYDEARFEWVLAGVPNQESTYCPRLSFSPQTIELIEDQP